MTDDSTAAKSVQDAISNSALAQNYRGQLSAALQIVESPTRMILACDYAEHVAWIYEEITHGDGGVHAAIRAIRRFLNGAASIHDVAQARSGVWAQFAVLRNSSPEGARIVSEVGVAAERAILVCCQRQLEEAGYVIHDKQVEAESVAFQASYAAALFAAGSDWDADDKEWRNAARNRGHEASDKETQWQIQRLLDYVGRKTVVDNDRGTSKGS